MKIVAEYPAYEERPGKRYRIQRHRPGRDWQETGSYRWLWAARWNAWFDAVMESGIVQTRVVDTKEDA